MREKADGVQVNILPSNIYPDFPSKYKIKAEYIDYLDLYLVYDIDINMNIMDRYNYLRQLHPYFTCTESIKKDLHYSIDYERENLKLFLDKPYCGYRWYPKAAWEVKCDLTEFFTDILNSTDSYLNSKWFDGPIKNDGFIITPLNGNREIKIKPKYLLTIDLLYTENKWIDRDGFEYKIECRDIELSNNTIWRCYPVYTSADNTHIVYEPREIRYDKVKPNTRKVVNNIINLGLFEHKYSYESIYRDKFNSNTCNWVEIVSTTNSIITKMIKKLQCVNVLDLGCGNGKILKYINHNKLKNYYGIDLDINMLAKAINFNNLDNITFNLLDLSKDWDQKGSWYTMDKNIKYETIFAINSLQHFCSDIFWEQLNQITIKNTKMLFNLVDMENNSQYDFEDSYIKRSDNVITYYFSPVHTKEMSEPFYSIDHFLEKYGWTIIEEYKSDTLLHQCYKWFVIIKL